MLRREIKGHVTFLCKVSPMQAVPSAFALFVDQARNGKIAVWRVVVTVLLVGVVWLAWTLAAFLLVAFYTGAFDDLANVGRTDGWPFVEEFFGSPAGLAAMLSSFIGIWLGIWLAVRLLHARPLRSVLGAGGRFSFSNFSRGLAAALIVSALSEAAFYAADPSIVRSDVPLGARLGWLAPLTLALLVQISAEELAFRGYLMQSLAALFRSPIIWAGVPALFFTLLHWDPNAAPAMRMAMLVSIAAFAATASLLVYRTGDVAAAMGVHLGVNFFSILVVSRMTWLDGAALLTGRPVDSEGWATGHAIWLAGLSLAMFAIILWILLAARSPLSVVAHGQSEAGTAAVPARVRSPRES